MRTILISAFLILSFQQAFGQGLKDKLYVGVNSSVYGSNDKHETINQDHGGSHKTQSKAFGFTVIPQIGIKISENNRVGIALGYSRDHETEKLHIGSSEFETKRDSKKNTYLLRSFFIQDINLSPTVSLFLQANMDFFKERENRAFLFASGGSDEYSHRAYYFHPNVVPGIRVKINENFAVELTYGRIGYLIGTLITDSGNIDSHYDSKKLDLNLTARTISFGLKYSFSNAMN